MNLFSELYAKHLAKTLFFISIGVSSSIGQNLLTKNILHDDLFATVVAVTWAVLLIMIYSWFVAVREQEMLDMQGSFDYHRILKSNNNIGARALTQEEQRQQEVNSGNQPVAKFNKVEFVHSVDPMTPEDKKPTWLKDEEKGKKL